jgi:hypothetical protein
MLTQKHHPSVRSLHGTVKKKVILKYEHTHIKHEQRLIIMCTGIFIPYIACVEDTRVYSFQQLLFEGNNKNWFCVTGQDCLTNVQYEQQNLQGQGQASGCRVHTLMCPNGLTVTGRCLTTKKETSNSQSGDCFQCCHLGGILIYQWIWTFKTGCYQSQIPQYLPTMSSSAVLPITDLLICDNSRNVSH